MFTSLKEDIPLFSTKVTHLERVLIQFYTNVTHLERDETVLNKGYTLGRGYDSVIDKGCMKIF